MTRQLIVALALLFFAARADAATELFLYLEGIEGESRDAQYEDWIDVLSYTAPVENPGTITGGSGGGAGKAVFGDLLISAFQSKASPNIFLATAQGEVIDELRLAIVESGEERRLVADWTLLDVLVASYQTGASGGDSRVMEAYAFDYAKVRYRTYGDDGEPVVRLAWDVAGNAPTTFPDDPPPPDIPEPATAALIAAGVAVAAWPSRRRRHLA